jgi:hypothetical protein
MTEVTDAERPDLPDDASLSERFRWWLLRRVAAWCGLKVGMKGTRPNYMGVPEMVVFVTYDATTLKVLGAIVRSFGGERRDVRQHHEWLH